MNNLIRKKIALIGCGPVGLFGALLLQHFGLDYVCIQKLSSARTHPSAHYISAFSKSLMYQIPGITQKMDQIQQDWNYFRSYRYVEGICGHQLGFKNHFEPTIQDQLKKSRELVGQTLSHLPQHKFHQILYENLKNKENIIFDQQITSIRQSQGVHKIFNSRGQQIANADYVVICNGINSRLRKYVGFHLQGKDSLLSIINIHFKSKDLAKYILQSKQQAMLHFSFGKKILGILVNHSLQQGEFILQIPNILLPVIDLKSFYSARDMILMNIDQKVSRKIRDIQIINIGDWKIQALLANKMYKNNIFLAGDSAHAFPPAGGFGMNSGIQDMHQVVHSLKTVIQNEKSDKQKIFQRYCKNRRQVDEKYRIKALQNYYQTIQIGKQLGYPGSSIPEYLQDSFLNSMISYVPDSATKMLQNIRSKNMKLFYKRKQLSPKLQLIFDQFDIESQNISKIRKQIMKANRDQNQISIWAKNDVDYELIKQVCGEIQRKNIYFHDFQEGQKIIGSDGVVLLK